MVNFTINGRELSAPKGTTILNAAEKAGIPIPHLCYLKELNEIAACRMCMVEVEGTPGSRLQHGDPGGHGDLHQLPASA